mmetsp:Transcript_2277/g.2216  ORF Transcript_2277/g.2216 Transcript_2277/m.2216 type:complete len:80 (-) Transcript_2277:283-522(-)
MMGRKTIFQQRKDSSNGSNSSNSVDSSPQTFSNHLVVPFDKKEHMKSTFANKCKAVAAERKKQRGQMPLFDIDDFESDQ